MIREYPFYNEGEEKPSIIVHICNCNNVYATLGDGGSRFANGSSWYFNKKNEIVIRLSGGGPLREQTIDKRSKNNNSKAYKYYTVDHQLILDAVRKHVKNLSDEEAEKAIFCEE